MYWRIIPESPRLLLEAEADFQRVKIKLYRHPNFLFNIMVEAVK